jgi:hypothetical protein
VSRFFGFHLEQKFMGQERKTRIILSGLVSISLMICGLIGYINDTGRISLSAPRTGAEQPVDIVRVIKLNYCGEENPGLCIVSIGSDSAQNALIVLKNTDPALADLYVSIKLGSFTRLYPCRSVQLSEDTFYCLGDQIPDNEELTMGVYSKSNNRLLARGFFSFSGGVAAVVESTSTPVKYTPGVNRPTNVPAATEAVATIPVVKIVTATPPPSYPNNTPSYP